MIKKLLELIAKVQGVVFAGKSRWLSGRPLQSHFLARNTVLLHPVRNDVPFLRWVLVRLLSVSTLASSARVASRDSVFAITPTLPGIVETPDLLLEGYQDSGIIDSAQYYIARSRAVMKQIREGWKYIDYLDGESLLELPVGIKKTIGGLEYLIGISSMELKPTHAELEVFMSFVIPQNGDTITFAGKGIKFAQEGGILPGARLELVSDYGCQLVRRLSSVI